MFSHFFHKIGVCRHGTKCSKRHIPPVRSRSIVLLNLATLFPKGSPVDNDTFDKIYEDIYVEMCKYGRIDKMYICENNNDHLGGAVFVLFEKEQDAMSAKDNLNTRWFNQKPVYSDLTHVVNFDDAICRKHYDQQGCARGDNCNFMHIRHPSKQLKKDLEMAQEKKWTLNSQTNSFNSNGNNIEAVKPLN